MARQVLTDAFWVEHQSPPTTPTEALMQTRPGEDVAASTMEQEHPLSGVIEQLLEDFPERDRDILIMSLMGQMSVRDIAVAIGLRKTQVHRRLQALMPQLAKRLKNNPEIMEWINASD